MIYSMRAAYLARESGRSPQQAAYGGRNILDLGYGPLSAQGVQDRIESGDIWLGRDGRAYTDALLRQEAERRQKAQSAMLADRGAMENGAARNLYADELARQQRYAAGLAAVYPAGTLDAALAANPAAGAYNAVPELAAEMRNVQFRSAERSRRQLKELRREAQAARNASRSGTLSAESRRRLAAAAEEKKQQAVELEEKLNRRGIQTRTNIGKLAGGMALKGADQAAYGIASTLDGGNRMLKEGLLGWTPEEYDGANTLTAQLKDRISRESEGNREYFAPNANTSKAARIADEIGTGTAAAIPQAVLALMTAGASLGTQAAAAGLEAASAAAASPGLAGTASRAISAMAKDPQYWLSFIQTAGPGYEQARAEGADELSAVSYGVINGLLNAAVEVGGGGIQELPVNLGRGGNAPLREWIQSALDEGKEEIVQGVIERGLQNLIYGKGNPLRSMSDGNAIFNPVTSAKEGAMGFAIGGILGGGQTLIQSGLNTLEARSALPGTERGDGDAVRIAGDGAEAQTGDFFNSGQVMAATAEDMENGGRMAPTAYDAPEAARSFRVRRIFPKRRKPARARFRGNPGKI